MSDVSSQKPKNLSEAWGFKPDDAGVELVQTDLGRVVEVFRSIKLQHQIEITPDGYLDISLIEEDGEPDSGWSSLRFAQSGKFLNVVNWP